MHPPTATYQSGLRVYKVVLLGEGGVGKSGKKTSIMESNEGRTTTAARTEFRKQTPNVAGLLVYRVVVKPISCVPRVFLSGTSKSLAY